MFSRITQLSDRPRLLSGLVIGLICLATFAAYSRVFNYAFVSYDDMVYVIENYNVHQGLRPETIAWAFRTTTDGNWFPLTWISYMLDVSLFGGEPGVIHMVNVGYHTASACLLFLVLRGMTGMTARSAVVALLFALHPLHVESVAWISERKDLLSAFFFMLTLLAYQKYARDGRTGSYLTTLGLYACGLMSKPMLVSAPLLLLMLDFWPLERTNRLGWRRLLLEKVPFGMLALASCIVTYWVQSHKAVVSYQRSPLSLNIKNAIVSYVSYIGKTLYPTDLTILYPFKYAIPTLQVAGCLLVLLVVSLLAALWRRNRSWFLVGWAWFIVALIPVIGIVRVGKQALADRYTYIPHIGLFVLLVWGAAELLPRRRRELTGALSLAVILPTLAILTWHQTGYWRDTISLFTHAIQVTENNSVAMSMLGFEYCKLGELDKARRLLEKAVEISPGNTVALVDLGIVYNKLNDPDRGAELFRRTLRMEPDFLLARYQLGSYLVSKNDIAGALQEYETLKRMNEGVANQLLTTIKLRQVQPSMP